MSLAGHRRIDIGCALRAVSFDRPVTGTGDPDYSDEKTTLLFFLFRIFRRLQRLATVVALDVTAYTNTPTATPMSKRGRTTPA